MYYGPADPGATAKSLTVGATIMPLQGSPHAETDIAPGPAGAIYLGDCRAGAVQWRGGLAALDAFIAELVGLRARVALAVQDTPTRRTA